ncbi:MAG: hypothetical protein E6I37_01180 [Chloroflexi bacterium]|nr:MAG: hypothetical protein E6I37_01180 [Chloroflexota bacterium]
MAALPAANPLEESPMRPSWKLALIGGEVTVLAAFTGIGIHMAMQPHRIAFRPPPLVLPSRQADVLPSVVTPVVSPRRPSAPAATAPALGPELFRKFGRQDHDLVIEQWDVLRRLMTAIERYVEAQVSERFRQSR